MRERVRLADCDLVVASRPGHGTQVSFEVPRTSPLPGDSEDSVSEIVK
jgi:hypothetical protein